MNYPEERPKQTAVRQGPIWNAKAATAAVEALAEESRVMEIDEPEQTRRLLREALPLAALRLQQLTQSHDERIAFQASKYLIDRGLGTLAPGGDYRTADDDVYTKLLAACVADFPLYNSDPE